MARARHESKQLGTGEDKVEDLWEKKEEQRLGKVRLDAHDSECHAGNVAERVTWECARGIPVSAMRQYFCPSHREQGTLHTNYGIESQDRHPREEA